MSHHYEEGAERRIQLPPVKTEPDKPRLIECGASVSTGGKVQLKKFELSADYHFHLSGKWAMPPGMTEEEAEEFRHEQVLRLRKEIEPIAQSEIDDLLSQKEGLS